MALTHLRLLRQNIMAGQTTTTNTRTLRTSTARSPSVTGVIVLTTGSQNAKILQTLSTAVNLLRFCRNELTNGQTAHGQIAACVRTYLHILHKIWTYPRQTLLSLIIPTIILLQLTTNRLMNQRSTYNIAYIPPMKQRTSILTLFSARTCRPSMANSQKSKASNKICIL